MSITERIKINGRDISDDDFARHTTRVREIAEKLGASGELETVPTFFEQVTAIALIAFAKAKVELAILETGLGGRLDATTAAGAEISAITQIDYDHQEYLGELLVEIAAEKAAIIHEGSTVVIGEQKPAAMDVLLRRCDEFEIVPRMECRADIQAIDSINKSMVMVFRTDNEIYHDPNLGLKGRHQIENARVAVMLAEVLSLEYGLKIDRDHVVDGLENAHHLGRLESSGRYLLDGAHNIAGAKALREFLDEFITQPITLIFGTMKDKDVAHIAEILFPKADRLILTRPASSRAMTVEEIRQFIPAAIDRKHVYLTRTVEQALSKAGDETSENGLVLITGSLYLVAEAKKILNNYVCTN